jgi:glycosyltransferase involved in cell wall biosynthesis
MKISIITVVYNRVDTIEKCINSVQNQKYKDFEHIIIDGGSTDGTLRKIESVPRKNTILVSESDEGIFDALNKGILLSSGDIIGVLNSDDYYADNNVFQVMIDLFSSSDIDMAFGDVEFFNSNNEKKVIRRYNSARFNPSRIRNGIMPAHPTMFVKSTCYSNNLYKTNYKIAADFEMIARLFKRFNISFVHVPLVLVRMRIGGVSTSGLASTLLLNQEILRACKENGYKSNWFYILMKYPYKLFEYFNL